ncbi:MAG: hypothetical protein ACYC6P_05260 [Ignavibacteriaceae bacterium]
MQSENENIYLWKKNIFVLLGEDNLVLKNIIKNWAITNNFNVTNGIENSDDIIAYPSFIMIIDRNLINENIYARFLRYNKAKFQENNKLDLISEGNFCIFVDDIKNRETPMIDYVLQLRKNNKIAADLIINILNHVSNLLRIK